MRTTIPLGRLPFGIASALSTALLSFAGGALAARPPSGRGPVQAQGFEIPDGVFKSWPSQREVSSDKLTGREVWRMTTTGRDFKAKNQYAYYNVPIWSPDGKYILWGHWGQDPSGMDTGLYVAPADGSKMWKVADTGWVGASFCWGGSARAIFHGVNGVWRVDLADGSRKKISSLHTRWQGLHCSIDGRVCLLGTGRGSSYWVRTDGSGEGVITRRGSDDNVPHPKDPNLVFVGGRRLFSLEGKLMAAIEDFRQGAAHWAVFPNGCWVCLPGTNAGTREGTHHGHDRRAVFDIYAGKQLKHTPMSGNGAGYSYTGHGGAHVSVNPNQDEPLILLEDVGRTPALVVIDPRKPVADKDYLRAVCLHNSALKYGQASHPHALFSPDGTKIGYNSDMSRAGEKFEHSDIFVVVFRKPDPPLGVAARRHGKDIVLSWKPGKRRRETRGYFVYEVAEGGMHKVTESPVRALSYRVEGAAGKGLRYRVSAAEWSGLESPAVAQKEVR